MVCNTLGTHLFLQCDTKRARYLVHYYFFKKSFSVNSCIKFALSKDTLLHFKEPLRLESKSLTDKIMHTGKTF